MVKVEGRVTGLDQEVTARVSPYGVMSTSVNPNGSTAGHALHLHLKVPDMVILRDEVSHRRVIGEHPDEFCRQVTLKAPRVVLQRLLFGLELTAR